MKLCWYPREFDSTLGYPEEGPPHPTLKVATYNVAGLKMDLTLSEHYCRKSKALLAWARDKKIDVLFIQEHICSKNEFGRMKVLANMFGYTVTLASRRRAPGEDDSSRGGAAILTRKLELTSVIVIRYGLGVKHTTRIALTSRHKTIIAAARGRTPQRTSNVRGRSKERTTVTRNNTCAPYAHLRPGQTDRPGGIRVLHDHDATRT